MLGWNDSVVQVVQVTQPRSQSARPPLRLVCAHSEEKEDCDEMRRLEKENPALKCQYCDKPVCSECAPSEYKDDEPHFMTCMCGRVGPGREDHECQGK